MGSDATDRSDVTFTHEAWFATTLRSIGDAVIATDTAGRVIFMNAVAEQLTGWTSDVARGCDLAEVFVIVSAETRRAVGNPVARVLREGGIVGLANHTVLIAQDGTERPIDDSAAPIRDASGALTGVVLIFRDVTERDQAERRIRAQYAVSGALLTATEIADGIPAVLAAIGEHLQWQFGACWLLDGEAAALRMYGVWRANAGGLAPFEAATRALTFARGGGMPGRVWASDAPTWIADIRADTDLPRHTAALSAGLHSAFAFPIRGAGGLLGVVEFFSATFRDPDETLLQTVTTIGQQIGQFIERTRAEEEKRAVAARVGAILTTALDCIITMDDRGRVVEWNPAAERTFGYPRDEAFGRQLGELIVPPSLREQHYAGLTHYLKTGEGPVLGRRIEITGMRADGSEFPVELAITRIPVAGPPLFTAYLRDLSEQRGAEAERVRLADQFRLLLESTGEGVYGVDLAGNCTFINRAAAAMLGYEPADVIGENAHLLMHHSHPDGSPYPMDDCPIYAAFHKGKECRLDTEVFWRADGTAIPVAYASFPIIEEGIVRGAVVTFSDISDRKEAERRQQDFIAMVAHDLKNPLAALLGHAQLLQRRAAYSERSVAAIVTQARRLERLIDDLRDVVRLDVQGLAVNRAPVDLAALVRGAVEGARAATDVHTLRFDAPPGPVIGQWDTSRIEQVLDNLLANAVKYSPDGGTIDIRLEARADEAVVTVRDRGIGIAPDALPHIFEPFYRAAAASATNAKGLGLGLSISKRLIEEHDGWMAVESTGEAGTGSVFSFGIPFAPRTEDEGLSGEVRSSERESSQQHTPNRELRTED